MEYYSRMDCSHSVLIFVVICVMFPILESKSISAME